MVDKNINILKKLTMGKRSVKSFDSLNLWQHFNDFPQVSALDFISGLEYSIHHTIMRDSDYNSTPSLPEKIAVKTLYMTAIHSAMLSGNENFSLYDIFKNAEDLIPSIIKNDNNPQYTSTVKNEEKYYYKSIKLNDNLYIGILPYYNIIPNTHIDYLDNTTIEYLKKINLVKFTKRVLVYSSIDNIDKFYKEWKKIVADQKEVNSFIQVFRNFEQIINRRAQSLGLLNISKEYKGLTNCNELLFNLIKTKTLSHTAKFSKDFNNALPGLYSFIEESTDFEFRIIYFGLFWKNALVRNSPQQGILMNELGSIIKVSTEKEKKDIYNFLINIFFNYDYKKPTTTSLIKTLTNKNFDELDPELILALNGETIHINEVKSPLYKKVFIKKFPKLSDEDF